MAIDGVTSVVIPPSRVTTGRSRLRLATIVGAAALLVSACGGGESTFESTAESPASESAPALLSGEFQTLGGTSIDLGSLEGQDIVFWFWAPW